MERIEALSREIKIVKEDTHAQPRDADTIDSDSQDVGPEVRAPSLTRVRAIFSKFAPAKISPKFAEQGIDQLESWMDINSIRDDHEKFLLLKMSIEPETYREVATALSNPHPGREYENLKSSILKAFTDSEAKRVQALLGGIQLGNRRPTQLLAEMCSLYKGPKDTIFEELFLSRLPPTVRGILVSMKQPGDHKQSIELIAQNADSIIEQTSGPSSTVNAISSETAMTSMQKSLNEMSTKISAIQNLKPAYNRTNRRDNARSGPTICRYHERFGNNRHENRKCHPTCKLHKAWIVAREAMTKNQ